MADPIHDAAEAGDVAKVMALLASGVKIDAREYSQTPLHYARTAEVAKVLLKAGASVSSRDILGQTPLHTASTAEVARVLLKARARVSSRASVGYTPLHRAASGGRADVVEFLLSVGANGKAKSEDGETPFDLAKRMGYLEGTDAYWLLNDAQYD